MKKLISLILCLLFLIGCSEKETYITTRKDMDGKKIGILSGTIYNQSIKRIYQESEYSEYQTVDNLIEALKEKKIDGFVIERPMAIALSANNEGITYINESVIPGNTGIIFSSKKEKLLKEFNEFLQKCKEDGYLDYLDKKWVIANCAEQINDSFYLSGDKGTIHAITSTDLQPFSFVNSNNGIVSGFEVDLIKKFCYEYDYNIDIKTTEFENVINSVKNNEYDIGFASIAITNDRKKEVAFSEPTYDNYGVFVVRQPFQNRKSEFDSLDDLNGHTIAVLNGSIYENSVKKKFANPQIGNYPSRSAAIEALKKKEVDGYVIEEAFAMTLKSQNPDLTYIEEPLDYVECAFVFANDKPELLEQFNEFIAESKQNGLIEYLNSKWVTEDSANYRNNRIELTGENGTLFVATSNDSAPYSFSVDGKYHGLEVEFLDQFCFEYGYDYVITNETFSSSLSGTLTNKYDIAFNSIGITKERKQKYIMSDPVYSCNGVIVTRCK